MFKPPRDPNASRVLAFVPQDTVAWVEAELAPEPFTLQIARSVRQVVSALVEDPPPRAVVLVADFDAVKPAELIELHSIRERGWFGAIIGIGNVPVALKSSLAIANVLGRPLRKGVLAAAILRAGVGIATNKMPKIDV